MKSWIFRLAIVGSIIAMGGLSVSAGEKEESQLRITSPRNGDIVGSTVELTYAWEKGTKGDHMHTSVYSQYQKGFEGTLHRLSPGKDQSRVTLANHDHDLLETSDSIEIEVKEPTTG